MNQKNEVDKFFEGLPSQDRPAEEILEPKLPEKAPEKEEEEKPRSNREARRLKQRLEESQEMNVELNNRVKELAEEVKKMKSSGNSVDPRISQIFSSDEAGKAGAKTLEQILDDRDARIRQSLAEELKQEQLKEKQAQKQYESFIDSQLENLEDQYGVDLTSNAPGARKARTEFLDLVSKLSPKDEDGTISGYADFGQTFEIYQSTRKEKSPDTTAKKEIAARSMERSGTGSYQPQPEGNMSFARARREIERQLIN